MMEINSEENQQRSDQDDDDEINLLPPNERQNESELEDDVSLEGIKDEETLIEERVSDSDREDTKGDSDSEGSNSAVGEADFDRMSEVRHEDSDSLHSDLSPPVPEESPQQREKLDSEESEKEHVKSAEEEEESSEDESDHEESKVGELIADIFGESDQDEEFEGFGEEDLAEAKRKKEEKKKKKRKKPVLSESDEGEKEDGAAAPAEESLPQEKEVEKPQESDDDDEELSKSHVVYDFDLMLQKKKEESGRRRKFRNVDIINDSDDLIADLLVQMKNSADEDRESNKKRVAATKKLKMLPQVVSQLKKLDLKVAFLDQGVLGVMNDWLMPLPDRSLPHLQIRSELLRLLAEFPPIDQGLLKTSGIGRAVMYLYKHPKESRENKERAGKLISEWSRPIFNLNTNFSAMTKEEREHRDFEHMPKKRKLRLESGEDASEDIGSAMAGDDRALKPGDKGWVGRARVPLPSTRDYVVRPKWNVDVEFIKGSGRKSLTRLDKHIRSFNERKKQSKVQRAVSISIEGRKMSL